MTIKINPMRAENLYMTNTYVDPTAGTLLHNIPMTEDGMYDSSRPDVFSGNCLISTPQGPRSITFVIKAATLKEAIIEFANALRDAIKEMQSEQIRKNIASGGGLIDMSKVKN